MSKGPDNSDLLRQLMDNMTDNIFFKDSDHKFIMINKANAKWFGFEEPQEAIGMDDFDLFDAEFAQSSLEDEKRVMETGEPMRGDEEQTAHNGMVVWGSVTKVPLRDKDGNIIGCIGIGRDITDMKRKEFELEEANKKLSETNEKLSEANEQIAEDLRMAAKLQKTFLPQTYPSFGSGEDKELLEFHHFHEADIEIGGDFCSVHKLSDTKAGLLICDVMGHGVRAALITGIIHTIAEDLAPKSESPGDFFTGMNRQLFPLLRTQDAFLFATACYLVIDTETGKLTGALAGHTLPFLIRPQQSEVSLLTIEQESAGPALAIVKDHEYQTFSVQIHPGDEVLMYTDGICEAMNAKCDEFGIPLLQETIQNHHKLPLKELLPRIVQVVRDYSNSEKLGDDICLLGFTLNDLSANT